jgi:hypothetical protein
LLRDGMCGDEHKRDAGRISLKRKDWRFIAGILLRQDDAGGVEQESENGRLIKSLGNQTNLEEKLRREPRGRRQMGRYRWSAGWRG